MSQIPNTYTLFSPDGDPSLWLKVGRDSVFSPLKWVEPGRVIPVLGRLSQKEDLQLVASLGYIARFCLIKKKA